jgi:purine-cytosine permease-like protein
MRFFIPFIIYLLPILLIVYVIKALFSKKHTHNENTQDYHEQETTYHQTHDDIIDVDYKVVDEEDDHND